MQEKLIIEQSKMHNTFYLEHPIIDYHFIKRPILNFSHEQKIDFSEKQKSSVFIESLRKISKNLYPLFFNSKLNKDLFLKRRWTNLFVVSGDYILTDSQNYKYALFFINNNDTAENFLQAFCELYKMVDVDKTKKTLEIFNKDLYDYLNINNVELELNKMGIEQVENILERNQE